MSDPRTAHELLPELYHHLGRIAARIQIRGAASPAISPTSLVHEAWLRLAPDPGRVYDPHHFRALAARVMRAVAVDLARMHGAHKRGGRLQQITLVDVGEPEQTVDLLALDQALTALAAEDARVADVVELRFFGGLEVEEIASALAVSPRTVKADWRFGRAWLSKRLAA
jgi:RNA polymerase sigma factor (TIGR02999 family)